METSEEIKGKNIEAKLKVWLLQGKSITHNEAQKMWGTSRLAVYKRRLVKKGMNIKTEMVYNGRDSYGRYSLEVKPKVDRIANRQYLQQA